MSNPNNNQITREVEVSSTPALLEMKEFDKILKIINELSQVGIIFNFANNCISAADILQSMLIKEGIESEIVEVQAIIVRHRPVKSTWFVGFDNQATNVGQEIDTHVVVITKTETPILIDISISHLLPDMHPWIVEPLPPTILERDVAEYKFQDFEINYKRKKFDKVPLFYKKTIHDKINGEVKLRKSIDTIIKFVVLAVVISIINFAANTALIIGKFTNWII
jgi:hypothetical protein